MSCGCTCLSKLCPTILNDLGLDSEFGGGPKKLSISGLDNSDRDSTFELFLQLQDKEEVQKKSQYLGWIFP